MIEIMTEPKDFELLIPYVKLLSEEVNVPFFQNVNEVSASFMQTNYITFLCKQDGLIRGYLTGYFFSAKEFYVTQIYTKNSKLTKELSDYLDKYLQEVGVVRVVGFSYPPPEVFEPYGYKLERYIISKYYPKKEG